MTGTVLVTRPEFAKARRVFCADKRLQVIDAPDDEASLAEIVRAERCRAVIVGVQPYNGPLYEALGQCGGPPGSIIARFGVGHDNIDKTLAQRHRIVVTNTPGVLDASVAEHTLWLIGCLARQLAQCHASMTAHQWDPQMGVELNGQTLGVLGFGAIGRRVAKMARDGFGMRVIAAGRVGVREFEEREGWHINRLKDEFGVEQYTSDANLVFECADVLSVHLPATRQTEDFVDAGKLAMMRPTSFLVNTARGAVLDEDALYDALANGRLAGAALDVYKSEPYRPQSPRRDLRELPNVVLTPHIGSHTAGANNAMARSALHNVSQFLQGRTDQLAQVN